MYFYYYLKKQLISLKINDYCSRNNINNLKKIMVKYRIILMSYMHLLMKVKEKL